MVSKTEDPSDKICLIILYVVEMTLLLIYRNVYVVLIGISDDTK